MNIYKLATTEHMQYPSKAAPEGYNQYTSMNGFVIVAASEDQARSLAAEAEDGGPWWLDRHLTTCEAVDVAGEPRIVMANEPTG